MEARKSGSFLERFHPWWSFLFHATFYHMVTLTGSVISFVQVTYNCLLLVVKTWGWGWLGVRYLNRDAGIFGDWMEAVPCHGGWAWLSLLFHVWMTCDIQFGWFLGTSVELNSRTWRELSLLFPCNLVFYLFGLVYFVGFKIVSIVPRDSNRTLATKTLLLDWCGELQIDCGHGFIMTNAIF